MLERSRDEECLSDLQIDQLRVRELDAVQCRHARVHLRVCRRCVARQVALQHDAEAFAACVPPWRGAAHGRSARSLVMGVAAAAVVLLIVLVRRPPEPGSVQVTASSSSEADAGQRAEISSAPTTRAKGSDLHLGFHVRRGQRSFLADESTVVQPGDLLRFHYSTAVARYLTIISVDVAGVVSVYYPPAEAPVLVSPGTGHDLDRAVELDGTLGFEIVYGIFCDYPIATSTLTKSISKSTAAPQLPEGCSLKRATFTKRSFE